MNYQETIEHLYKHLPMFSRIGAAAYKEDLHNTIALCKYLDDPHEKFKCVHVAGTNGKGSTSHMLAALMQQAGFKTGLYTSPHLKNFGERIRINGEMISEQFVIDFVERTKVITKEIQPSFFELTVAMAFQYFAEQQVDIAIIETGLGGRLDSTNVITPILSVITNIGYDHMNILGNTLEAIAFEKAGIIKSSVPVVIGESLPETKNIFINKAKECNASIHFASEQYLVSNIVASLDSLSCDVTDTTCSITEHFVLDLNGQYQTKNLCTVLCAEGILFEKGFAVKDKDEKYAYANTKKLTGLSGRWDVISKDPTIVLDVAHNEDGMKEVLKQVGSGQSGVGSRESGVGSTESGVGGSPFRELEGEREQSGGGFPFGELEGEREQSGGGFPFRELEGERGQSGVGGSPFRELEGGHVHFVIGMVNDKDISKVLSLMPKDAKYYFTNAHIPRAMPHEELKTLAFKYGLIGEGFDNVNTAIEAAKKQLAKNDIIVVCGSIFVVAEVETYNFSKAI